MQLSKFITGVLFCAAISFSSFTNTDSATIKGTLSPQDGSDEIIAISSKDTLQASISFGNFQFSDVRPGTYIIIIHARAPYKNYEKDDVVVTDGSFTDLGTITLEQ